jgi:predicted nucleotidyltransferase
VLKTAELVEVLRAALQPLSAQVEQALVSGSVARQNDTARSDVNLLVVGQDLACDALLAALEGAGQTLRHKVNPALCTEADLRTRRASDTAFIQHVLQHVMQQLMQHVIQPPDSMCDTALASLGNGAERARATRRVMAHRWRAFDMLAQTLD